MNKKEAICKEIQEELSLIISKKGEKWVKEQYEQTVLNSKNAELSLFFIAKVKGCDINAHINNILESSDLDAMIAATSYAPDYEDKLYNKVITKSNGRKHPKHCLTTAENTNNIKLISRAEKVILKSKDPELCWAFAKNVTFADIKSLENVVLNSNDYGCMIKFAETIEEANVNCLANKILESKDPLYNYRFAHEVKEADIEKHAQVVIESKNPQYNYSFALLIKGADIEKHAQVVIESKDLKYNYLFAKEVKGADVRRHGKVIIESGDLSYNWDFAALPGCDIIAHKDVIMNSGDDDYINKFDPWYGERYDTEVLKQKILSLK